MTVASSLLELTRGAHFARDRGDRVQREQPSTLELNETQRGIFVCR